MGEKNKKETLSTVYIDYLSKKAIDKLVLEGEIAEVCNPEQVIADMKKAKENKGSVYIYKRKKQIRAICIFEIEEREIPLDAAIVKEKEVIADALKENKERVVEAESVEEMQTVKKNCYVVKGFYLIPSCEERREEYKKVYHDIIKGHMLETQSEIPACIWEDEIIMSNQIVHNGKMTSAASGGAGLGAVLGLLFGIIFGSDNIGMCVLWGMVIGGILSAGTTKIVFTK